MPAKDARKLREEPPRGTEAPAALARLVNFGVGARGERLEIAPQFRLGGEGGNAPEVGGDFLVKQVKALRLLDRELAIRLGLEPVERLLQLRPGRTLGGDEAREVDDQGRGGMTKNEGRMTKEARRRNGECAGASVSRFIWVSGFDILSSFVIRHSSLKKLPPFHIRVLPDDLRDELLGIEQGKANAATFEHLLEFAQAVPLQVAAEVAVEVVDAAHGSPQMRRVAARFSPAG